MLILEGKYNSARVMTDNPDETTLSQIYSILSNPAFEGMNIVIMEDCHKGEGAVIGFTATMNGKIIPNIVGVDINCGIEAYLLEGVTEVDFPRFDRYVRRNIPSGYDVRTSPHKFVEKEKKLMSEVEDIVRELDLRGQRVINSLGTLGGGNHFIEIDRDEKDRLWLVIHSGSRNFGLQIALHHQKIAKNRMQYIYGTAYPYKTQEYLEDNDKEAYLADMGVAQRYASLNRRIMASELCLYFNLNLLEIEQVKSSHNYIDIGEGIIRKGAISAKQDERVVIPLNMRDGTIIARGKGNAERNFSAPHGAGRALSRTKAKENLSLEDFKKDMEGIWSSCITQGTLDEAPRAYKDFQDILDTIKDTVDIEFHIKPVYVFKAQEKRKKRK